MDASDSVDEQRAAAPPVPRVSMVLPVHNGAEYLEAAIDSVLAQSFADFELICVDDASSDASPALLAAAAARDPRLHLIRLDQNVGLPAALNRGFRAARGEYFSWTSDDNLLRPHMLEKLVAALDANPDCGVAHSHFTVIDPAGTPQNLVRAGPSDDLLLGNNVGASFLYRRAVDHALGGYDSSLFGAEDYDFWLRASAHFRFVQVDEDLYLYRKHPRSLTNSRAAAIQTLTTDVVLRALSPQVPRRRRGVVLLDQFRRNHFRLRLDLLARGAMAAPGSAMQQAASLAWHAVRVIRQQWRRN
jgi:glycosyltransferase involved in cell wall biosynthesis